MGYTEVGLHVGMARRMESGAPAGGVMLSASTARLVQSAAALAGPEMVHIKRADKPVVARRLLGILVQAWPIGRSDSTLVVRSGEMSTLTAILERSRRSRGRGGCGRSGGYRQDTLVREAAAIANRRGADVFTAFCAHAHEVPFHVVAQLLRAVTGVNNLDGVAARAHVRAQIPDAGDEDLVLLYDVLGIRNPDVPSPNIDPDTRRRRLSALMNSMSLARTEPAVCVIEDAHWIDEVSESLIAVVLTVIRQTSSMVLITYAPSTGECWHTRQALRRFHLSH